MTTPEAHSIYFEKLSPGLILLHMTEGKLLSIKWELRVVSFKVANRNASAPAPNFLGPVRAASLDPDGSR